VVRRPVTAAWAALRPESDQNRKLISLMRANGRIPHPYFLTRMLFTPGQCDSLFPKPDAGAASTAFESQQQYLQRAVPLDAVNRVSYLESRCYMLNTLLRDTDFMSMSQGLEVRVPLIDHHLARTVLALPGAWKLNRTPKRLLVGSLAESLPEQIVHRQKRGFTLPFEQWMRQELRSEIEPGLAAKRISGGPLAGLLDGSDVQQIWQQFLQGKVSWTRPWS